MSQIPIDLATSLKQEITLIDTLLQALETEKQALITRQFEQLESLSEQKQALSKELEESARNRVISLCNSADATHYNSCLRTYLEQLHPEQAKEITDLNKQLMEKLIQCREYNLINGQVITANLNTRREIVSALTGQDKQEAGKTYTAKGNIKKGGDSKRYQQV